jgi:DNA-directed RNA polymerase specialized sigma24 family protein
VRRNGGQVAVNPRATLRLSAERNNATAWQREFENTAEELLWLSEVMTGSMQAGEQCIAEAIELVEATPEVGQEWMHSWVKRMLVHAALKRISGAIRELMALAGPRRAVTVARVRGSALDREKLRLIPPQRIIASLDVLERACLILYVYLAYPVVDCALLLECSRGLIVSVSERVMTKIAGLDQLYRDDCWDVDSSTSLGVAEWVS